MKVIRSANDNAPVNSALVPLLPIIDLLALQAVKEQNMNRRANGNAPPKGGIGVQA